jgi:hypothetical protein
LTGSGFPDESQWILPAAGYNRLFLPEPVGNVFQRFADVECGAAGAEADKEFFIETGLAEEYRPG